MIWISNYISLFYESVIIYPWPNRKVMYAGLKTPEYYSASPDIACISLNGDFM